MPEYSDPYKMLLNAYGFSLLNSGQTDKAISCFNKILIEDFDDEFDVKEEGGFDQYNVWSEVW